MEQGHCRASLESRISERSLAPSGKVCRCQRWERLARRGLEAEAAVFGFRHMLRRSHSIGRRCLLPGDSLTVAHGSSKGRSPSRDMRSSCRRLVASGLGSGSMLTTGWMPSALTAADGPSHGRPWAAGDIGGLGSLWRMLDAQAGRLARTDCAGCAASGLGCALAAGIRGRAAGYRGGRPRKAARARRNGGYLSPLPSLRPAPQRRRTAAAGPKDRCLAQLRRVQVLVAQGPLPWADMVAECMSALYERVWRMTRGFVDRVAEPWETEQDRGRELSSLMDLPFFDGHAASCGERALARCI